MKNFKHADKAVLFFIVLISSAFNCIAQNDIEYTKLYKHFVIKEHWVQSERFAEWFDNLKTTRKTTLHDSILKKLPLPPPLAVFDRKKSTHFKISPEYYTYYSFPDEFKTDSTVSYGISNIHRIDRSTNKRKTFSTTSFNLLDGTETRYQDDHRYSLLAENKNLTKEICGYNCFQVLMRDNNTKREVELYVTAEIKLEFHPVLNLKKCLSKYYPLYIRFYNTELPEEEFREYQFFELE